MAISYNGLWKILIDNGMKKGDLKRRTGISSGTIAKMTNGEAVTLTVLEKICNELNCDIGDLVEIDTFNDKKVELRTSAGEMVIEGENLDMGKLSLDESIITVEGTINSIVYSKERKPQESFIKRLFK